MLSAVGVPTYGRLSAPRDPDRACDSVVVRSIGKNADFHRNSSKVIENILSQTRSEATGVPDTANIATHERTSPHLKPHRACGSVVSRSISKNAKFDCF